MSDDTEHMNSKNAAPQCIATNSPKAREKLSLVDPTDDQFETLKEQLQRRMSENRGETIYELGVNEGKSILDSTTSRNNIGLILSLALQFWNSLIFLDGGGNGLDEDNYSAALATLEALAATINADVVELGKRRVEKGFTGQYLLRRRVDDTDFMEIR